MSETIRIEFTVHGHMPPKKDGAKSMWDKPVEAKRLVAMRRSALTAMRDANLLTRNISLHLLVHLGRDNSRSVGDLDNFITGVCDGLMAAHQQAALDELWAAPELQDIHPHRSIAIEDDSEVMEIDARKIAGPPSEPWYKVVLEGETTP